MWWWVKPIAGSIATTRCRPRPGCCASWRGTPGSSSSHTNGVCPIQAATWRAFHCPSDDRARGLQGRWDRSKPERGQPDPWCDPGIRLVLPVTRPYQLGAGGLGQLSEHLAMRWVQQQPMGHTTGEDPVSAIPLGASAGRVEDAVDIHQDQRRRRLHASTVRARQATC
jgi:hypothetical protein